MKWLAILTFSLSTLAACDQGSTGREMIEYDVAGAPEAAPTFTDDRGWEITLTRAELTFGPLVFCSHQPTFLKSDSLTDCGQVLGELGAAATWDLLADDDVPLGRLTGITGQIHSAQYDFGWNWPSGLGSPLWRGEAGAASLTLAGTAAKGGVTHAFDFTLDAEPRAAGLYTVAGLAAEGSPSTATTRVTLATSTRKFLRYIDFDLLEEQAEPFTLVPGSALENQLRLGLTTGTPVTFTWR
jgi:hypothetical protein